MHRIFINIFLQKLIITIEKQTQSVIDSGALTTLANFFLTSKNTIFRRDSCLAVSNIAAGTYCQVVNLSNIKFFL